MNFHRELLARDTNYETNLHSIVDIAVRHVKSTQSAFFFAALAVLGHSGTCVLCLSTALRFDMFGDN